MQASVSGTGASKVPASCAPAIDAALAIIEAKPRICRTLVDRDLSATGATKVVLLHATQDITIGKATVLYTEATSADTGSTIKLGKESDDDYFYTGATATEVAEWAEAELVLLKSDLKAGDTLLFASSQKTGAGVIQVWIEYTID